MKTLAERLRALIDNEYGGSLNAAAKDIGVFQSGLHRLASGMSKDAHTKTMQRIAAKFDTTIDWLMDGHGNPPECLSLPPRRKRYVREWVR